CISRTATSPLSPIGTASRPWSIRRCSPTGPWSRSMILVWALCAPWPRWWISRTPRASQADQPQMWDSTTPKCWDACSRAPRPRAAAGGDGVAEAAAAKMPAHPLSGVTILDLATIQAGPYGAALLADLGARVIKIDATDRRLDEGRRSTAQAMADTRTYAGKECLQVDLQTPEGKEIVHKLIAKADVLSHNYRLGVRERLQVDWETCRKINPRLVHVWMGTYGENGRHARRPGAHPIPGAIMGGAMRQMGRGMPPSPEQVMDIEGIAEATRWIMKSNWGPDQNVSAAVATGIILGLRARDLTGKGQPV